MVTKEEILYQFTGKNVLNGTKWNVLYSYGTFLDNFKYVYWIPNTKLV